jgi:HAD superfamily hydrolase (TIGR01549 family)
VAPEALAVAAITIDFGNTLVRVDRPGLRGVVEQTRDVLVRKGIVTDGAAFIDVWVEERERQFREDVPEFREPDIEHRAHRVLARLRGMTPPPPEERWDDAAAAAHVAPGEIGEVTDAYSAAFVGRMAPVHDATATLERLAGDGFRLAILSNWPLALTIDRFAEAHGWTPYLRAIVVSERVGIIKPHPAIFRAAESALGLEERHAGSILHVGDDWAADVVGARRAGWRAAYLRDRQHDTPLPTSEPGDGLATDATVTADLAIDELADIPPLVRHAPASIAEAARS